MQAAIFAILLMSSVSAKAMEFGDRPGMAGVSLPPARNVTLSDDRMRRQIGGRTTIAAIKNAQSKLADRPRPVSNIVGKRVSSIIKDGLGRLSQEFIIVSADSQFRTSLRHPVSIRRKPIVVFGSMRFDDHPGSMSNGFKDMTAATINIGGHPDHKVRLQSVVPVQPVMLLALRGR
jgi:hypothetical protein